MELGQFAQPAPCWVRAHTLLWCRLKLPIKLDGKLQAKSPPETVNGTMLAQAIVMRLCKWLFFRPRQFALCIDNLDGNVKKNQPTGEVCRRQGKSSVKNN